MRRSHRATGSLAGIPWPGGCSSISITLLLLSQETARSIDESPNTPPIKSRSNPLNVRGSPRTAKKQSRSTRTEGFLRPRHAPTHHAMRRGHASANLAKSIMSLRVRSAQASLDSQASTSQASGGMRVSVQTAHHHTSRRNSPMHVGYCLA